MHSFPVKRSLIVILLLALLGLTACGSSGSTGTSPGNTSSGSSNHASITIGSKLDPDSQLLGEMYALLLQNKGFNVTTKLGLGQTPVLFGAIRSGSIDMYPEFTGTALTNILKLPPTQNAKQDYQTVKTDYQKDYQITWLDPAYNLNDSYGLCTSQAVAKKYNLHTISDVGPVASQLVLAAPQDAIALAGVLPAMESAYNLHFKQVKQISEPLTYEAVTSGNADLNICYTTDAHIVTDNFVVLKDNKNVFPIYNPAPIVRDSVLQKSPSIPSILNPLEPKLSTSTIVQLIAKVSIQHQSVQSVAQTFLKQQGLLP
jgi:osmoprotectant transport system substrate-binding protein